MESNIIYLVELHNGRDNQVRNVGCTYHFSIPSTSTNTALYSRKKPSGSAIWVTSRGYARVRPLLSPNVHLHRVLNPLISTTKPRLLALHCQGVRCYTRGSMIYWP